MYNSPSSAPQPVIRPANDEDVSALTALINAAFVVEQIVFDGDRIDDLGVRVYMSSGSFLVAEGGDSRTPWGCVYVEHRGDVSYLGLLSVQPKRQGTGLGRRLVAAAEEFARSAGSRTMELRVISARGGQLLPFYQRLGYAIVRNEPFPANLAAKVESHYILMSKQLA